MNKSIHQLIKEAAAKRPSKAEVKAEVDARRAKALKDYEEHSAKKKELEVDFAKRGLHKNKPDLPGKEIDGDKLTSYYDNLRNFMTSSKEKGPGFEEAAYSVVYNHGIGRHLSSKTGLPHKLIPGFVRANPDEGHMGWDDGKA